MKFEKTEVFGMESSFRGMRNPKESWHLSDSYFNYQSDPRMSNDYVFGEFVIGPNDLRLAQTLIKAGTEHRKFLRQIFVSVDITAPLYWWKEFETYKVGTTSNSTSTMHKLTSKPITRDCFEMDDFVSANISSLETTSDAWDIIIDLCEKLRLKYIETKDKVYWKELVRILPESWVQTRTVTMSYENVRTMIHQRTNHKLTEWSNSFMKWAKTLPNSEELLFFNQSSSNE